MDLACQNCFIPIPKEQEITFWPLPFLGPVNSSYCIKLEVSLYLLKRKRCDFCTNVERFVFEHQKFALDRKTALPRK